MPDANPTEALLTKGRAGKGVQGCALAPPPGFAYVGRKCEEYAKTRTRASFNWCAEFKRGRESFEDEARTGRRQLQSFEKMFKQLKHLCGRTEELSIVQDLNENWVLDQHRCRPLFANTFLSVSVVPDGCRTN
ncbi:hypothetical protein EVAR_54401_1 [Eumeta japonica]|uniref:Uncharacterized protein n=1 Tax=Eumeta variegata TaxID=151549 RepID=A0A4C1Y312_EUMVA|nr:hypothetical protein EVAR_54401_1 [Eumeta japonica]